MATHPTPDNRFLVFTYLGAALIFSVGIALSIGLWRHGTTLIEREADAYLDNRASLVLAGIERRMAEYQTLLLGVQGLFLSTERVGRSAFRRYTDNLQLGERTPGIRALHFTRHVRHDQLQRFVSDVRADRSVDPAGYPDFTVRPDGERPEYYIIEYIEPLAGNLAAFGLDAHTQPTNRASFLAARDTGQFNLTPPFQLVQAPAGERGLVLRAPVYHYGAPLDDVAQRRKAFVGLVGITLDTRALFSDVLAEVLADRYQVIIHDIGPAEDTASGGAVPVFDSVPGRTARLDTTGSAYKSRELVVGGRQWRVDMVAHAGWLASRPGNRVPAIILGAGIAISVLMAALYFALSRSRARALRLANRMTRDLRQSEQRFRLLAELSTDWFWEQDQEGRFTSISGSNSGKTPLPFERLAGRTRWELAPDALSEEQWQEHRDKLAARVPFEIEYAVTGADGTKHWVIARGAPHYGDDGQFLGYQGSAQDVTERHRTTETIARSSAVLHATLENIDQGISVVDSNLCLLACNDRFRELLGFPASLARPGTPFEAFARYNAERGEYGEGDVDQQVRYRVELARRFEPHRFRRVRPDGTVLEIVGTPMPQGGFVTTYADVTEQVRAEEALRQQAAILQTTLDHLEQGISVMDANLHMTAMNRRFCELLDFPEEMARNGAPFEAFFRYNAERGEYGEGDIETMVRDKIALARRFEPHCFKRTRPNGRIIEVRGTPIAGGGFVTSYTDITAREHAEQAIRELNENLEQRVRERTAELEASNQELESFSYSVSHDLRAPLRALHGFSHLLEEEYGHLLDQTGSNYLHRIRSASERMGQLIDDLISLARIGRQTLERVDVDLGALAEEIATALREQHPGRKVRWRIDTHLQVRADPVLLRALIENLLRNAWKFTAERDDALIELGSQPGATTPVLFVRDNGAGFDMAYADKLFQPFQRLHDSERFEGSGIGLAIVHRIVRRHGGRIWAEAEPDQGATFYFTLAPEQTG